jgi:segregation and condensation protein B
LFVSSLNPLSQLIEAALFAANRPLTLEELGALDPDAGEAEVRTALETLREHYDFDGHAVELTELAGGWQVVTRAAFAAAIERARAASRTPRLSPATLETLATIAYRQPVGRAEIEEIRGVNAGGILRTLQERGLIEVVGRSEGLGRPLLYGTTPLFLELLGLRDLAELPRAEELTIALEPHAPAIDNDEEDDQGALASVAEG